ncbi:hypothetical protein HZS55_09105 [Halosimplex rubrum]|uniref:Uncharacterized protein n=1 Tax=Halosimplex rubrum TaxID=869889 RepID=A0A7D5P4U0_9EURY|nr:hypothetical protein [Halosimplex rubrum]QLH77442.1 hypothetical protein HZS55_09105 [Halosimplex rubrum]
MALERLSINVGARVSDATAGLTRVNMKLDETADEADEASGALSRTSAAMTAAGASAQSARLSIGAVSAGLSGSLIPALAALTAGAGAATVAVGGLTAGLGAAGGALGLLLGVGAVTHMRQLKREFARTRLEVMQIIEPLGDEFYPLLQTGIDAVPDLTEEMVAAVGSTEEFKESLRGYGGIAMDVLPAATGAAFDLARAYQDDLRAGVNWLLANGPGAFEAIQSTTNELKPELITFGQVVADLGPDALEFGTAVADTLLPPLTALLRLTDAGLETWAALPGPLQDATAAAIALGPAIWKIHGAMSAIGGLGNIFAGSGLSGVGASIGSAAGATALGGAIGGAIGVGIVRVLHQTGVMDAINQSGQDTRENIGGERADRAVSTAAKNPATRQFFRLGAGVSALANPNDDQGFFGGVSQMDQTIADATARTQRTEVQQTDNSRTVENLEIYAGSRRGGQQAAAAFLRETESENVRDTSSGR